MKKRCEEKPPEWHCEQFSKRYGITFGSYTAQNSSAEPKTNGAYSANYHDNRCCMCCSPHYLYPSNFRSFRFLDKEISLFLGPRQTGKSSLIRHTLPKAKVFNLLDQATFLKLSVSPWYLHFEDLRFLRDLY